MTNESKTNLLKSLLNESQEQPGENKSTFTNKYISNTPSIQNALTFDQLQWQGYTIGLNGDLGVEGGYLYLYDPDGNQVMKKKPVYKDTECSLISIDIDENGDMYGLFVYDNKIHLAYFYNPFMKTADGEYDLIIKIAYNLNNDIQDIFNTIGGENGTVFNTDIKKSPIDSNFLINWAFDNQNSNYTLLTIKYTVNVGSANTYEYRYTTIGSYSYNWIKSVKANWTNDNVNFTMLIQSTNYTDSIKGAEFYKVTGNFSEGSTLSKTLILSEPNYYFTEYTATTNYPTSKNAVQKDDSIYFVSNHIDTSTNACTMKIYKYDTSLSVIWEKEGIYNSTKVANCCNIILINNQIFAWVTLITDLTDPSFAGRTAYFMHILNSSINEIKVADNVNYTIGFIGIIQNFFNYYVIYLKVAFISQYILTYTFRPDGYNGTPYFSDKSIVSDSMQLLNGEGNIVFDRNLYDKQLTNNMVSSITQVPYNYLNGVSIVNENLMSKTNNIIDSGSEELEKNMYEELIISNLDQFKVYDNNNGSSLNANSSLQVAKNVYNGFEDNYKITHYRINKGSTHIDYPITNIVRDNNIAEISIYIYYNGEDNVQLFDSSFTVPFLTIDLSKLEMNKLYIIKQKVKVE